MEEDRYKAIGRKIREVREEAGMSQRDLAEMLDYESATAISLIEAGERKISVSDLETIADKLHKDIRFFLGKVDDKPNLKFALRADKELSKTDTEKVLSFVDFIKQQNVERRREE